jgi:hypothetical protein
VNEHEKAVFAEIAHTTDLQLDEELLLAAALCDRELNDILEEYSNFSGDIVRRMVRAASGDWSEEQYHRQRLAIAFDAVMLRHSLSYEQMERLKIIVQLSM